jgi:hypothetical protein
LVSAARANAFMTELLEALAGELRDLDVDAAVQLDGFGPEDPDTAYAIVPHELFATLTPDAEPTAAQLARTVAIVTEQPGSIWSEHAIDGARRCGAVMDISRVGLIELQRLGIAAEHLQLGYTTRWDAWGDADTPRPIDVAVLGRLNRRREVHLSGYADVLAARELRLLLPGPEPKITDAASFVTGAAKHELLASSEILLNVRGIVPPYFEWVRALEAIANGAVLVTEHGAGHAPLVPGEHFVSGSPESLGLLADALLRAPQRLERMRHDAYEFVRAELPMARGARRLADVADGLLQGRFRPIEDPLPTANAAGAGPPPAVSTLPEPLLPDFTDPAAEPLPAGTPGDPQRRALTLARRAARRTSAAETVRASGKDPSAVEVAYETPAHPAASPRVSICVALFEQPTEVHDALASVATQDLDDIELLVHDDASGDDSVAIVREFLERRPWLPARLLRRTVNAGLPIARNTLLRHARAPYALMLDADNALYPQAARRLAAALDAAPKALFAYGVLAVRRDGRADGLLSAQGWDPAVFAQRNPIDALALVRRDRVLELGGYRDDDRLHGWEDYELWVRAAAHGAHGVHVPTFVARYRSTPGSMAHFSDLDAEGMKEVLRELHPGVMTTEEPIR